MTEIKKEVAAAGGTYKKCAFKLNGNDAYEVNGKTYTKHQLIESLPRLNKRKGRVTTSFLHVIESIKAANNTDDLSLIVNELECNHLNGSLELSPEQWVWVSSASLGRISELSDINNQRKERDEHGTR